MSLAGILARKGAAVVFSHTEPGSYDQATDTTTTPATSGVAGHAMEIDGDPELYKALELLTTQSPTLLFKPDTPGQLPGLGWTVFWGGETFTVKNITRLAMNGTAQAARIVVTGS
jgi:hypothetical protein